jgi:hypothetical protein
MPEAQPLVLPHYHPLHLTDATDVKHGTNGHWLGTQVGTDDATAVT